MKEISKNLKYDRRSFLRRTVMTVVAAQFASIRVRTREKSSFEIFRFGYGKAVNDKKVPHL